MNQENTDPLPILNQNPSQNKQQTLPYNQNSSVQNLKKVETTLNQQQLTKTKQLQQTSQQQCKDNPQSQFLQSKLSKQKVNKDSKQTQDIYKNFKRDWKVRISSKQRTTSLLKKEQNDETMNIDQSKQQQSNLDQSIINKHLSFLNSRAEETDQQQPVKMQFIPHQIKSNSTNQLHFKKMDIIPALENQHNRFRSYITKQRKKLFANKNERYQAPNRQFISTATKKSMNITSQMQPKKKYKESRQLKMQQQLKSIEITKETNKQELIQNGKKLFKLFYPSFNEESLFTIKKYKNCIVFSLMPTITKAIIFHYIKDVYFGNVSIDQNGKIQKNGQGIEIVKQRHFYQGFFVNGKKNGRGKIIYENGDIYDGQWNQGQIYGYGRYSDRKNDTNYEGFWKKGQFCGQKNSHNEHPFQFL